MTQISDSIIEKLKKLLALADAGSNSTVAEMENAMTQAKRLMAKHQLSMADVEKETLECFEALLKPRVRYAKWELLLVHAVEDLCSVKHFIRVQHATNGSRRVLRYILNYVGSEADATIAAGFFKALLHQVKVLAGTYFRVHNVAERYYNSYLLGISWRILERCREKVRMENPHEEVKYGALTVMKTSKAIKHLEQKGVRYAKSKPSRVDLESYLAGRAQGEHVDLSVGQKIGVDGE